MNGEVIARAPRKECNGLQDADEAFGSLRKYADQPRWEAEGEGRRVSALVKRVEQPRRLFDDLETRWAEDREQVISFVILSKSAPSGEGGERGGG